MTKEVPDFVTVEIYRLESKLRLASENLIKLKSEGKGKGENAFVLAEWKEADLKKKLSAA